MEGTQASSESTIGSSEGTIYENDLYQQKLLLIKTEKLPANVVGS